MLGGNLIVRGGFTVGRVDVIGGNTYLLVGTTATRNANQFALLIYSLANPLSPQLVSTSARPIVIPAPRAVLLIHRNVTGVGSVL